MIRRAIDRDERVLRRMDRAQWSTLHSPAPARVGPFDIEGALVYEIDHELAGYVQTGPLWEIPAVAHVREIRGLLVDPRFRGRGIGRALLEAAIEQAELDGVRKLTLRVLSHNEPARALYAACGFEVEGVSRGLFFLDGVYVDDVLLALDLTTPRR
ncbi:GNAT family N-acetyltransferase [Solirubrobacter taibaiensis]|nr:GNAT family N-acetyltransferase [Solirubrobacter taibaiensis]